MSLTSKWSSAADVSGVGSINWTSYHRHTIIPTASLQMDVVLEIAQTMPLRNLHHRFGSLLKEKGYNTEKVKTKQNIGNGPSRRIE